MLAELQARFPIEPYRLRNPTDCALPDISRNPGAPGNVHDPGQRDRSGLLRFYRFVET
mgnify:CR=1 FL=1